MEKIGMHYLYSYQEHWMPKNEIVTFRLYQINLDGDDSRIFRKYWESSPIHYVERINPL